MSLKDLICESTEGGKLSLGRVTFLILLAIAIVSWIQAKEIPSTLRDMLGILMAYNFGKKVAPKWAKSSAS